MSAESSAAPEMSEARKRAEARKAKILARGSTGLAKLASTARGEEGSVLYDTSTPSRSSTPQPPTKPSTSTAQPPISRSAFSSPFPGQQQDPSLAYQAQLEQMMSMMGGAGLGGSGPPGQPDFMAQMQAMMGGVGGGAGSGLSTPLALGDVDPTTEPASPGLNGQPNLMDMMAGFPGMPPGFDPSSMFGGAGAGGAGPSIGMGGGLGGGSPQPKPLIAKFFPLIHMFSVLLFWAFVVGFWEPSVRHARLGLVGSANENWMRWALVDGGRAILPGTDMLVERLPVFWAFITMEVLLQSTQIVLFKPTRPSGGLMGLLSNFLPFLPPNIQLLINTTARYATMGSQIWRDGCLLVFLMGLTVVWAGWRGGGLVGGHGMEL